MLRDVESDLSAKVIPEEAVMPMQWFSSIATLPRECVPIPIPLLVPDESADVGDTNIEEAVAVADRRYLDSNSGKASDSDADCDSHSDEVGDDDRLADRGAGNREYLKSALMAHDIWKDRSFWEQALWQCTMEQVQYSSCDADMQENTESSIRIPLLDYQI